MINFFSNILCGQPSPERLTVRNPKTSYVLSEVPEVVISVGFDRKVVAVGSQVHAAQAGQSVKLVNPFAHPRTLFSDFTIGELLLKAFVKRMGSRSILVTSTEVVVHPQGDAFRGFTQIEIRALHEMARAAGAYEVHVWQGLALTDQELFTHQFPAEEQFFFMRQTQFKQPQS